MPIARVISGGQTGADRAALDAAIALGVPHGGWVPKGRRAEDGRIPERYHVEETDSRDYAERTRRNVLDSDATLVVSVGPLDRGSAKTLELARRHGKPHRHVDLARTPMPQAVESIVAWLDGLRCSVLNVAGPREPKLPIAGRDRPIIYEQTYALVTAVLLRSRPDC